MSITNLVCISDTHIGDGLALFPGNKPFVLDTGMVLTPSKMQLRLWEMWKDFWGWVAVATRGEPYIIYHGGDLVEGTPHNTKHQATPNYADQQKMAEKIMAPILRNSRCIGYYQVRGTSAHVGESAENEERIAKALGAIPDSGGRYSRDELWLEMSRRGNKHKYLIHGMHHVGTASSMAYESSALMRELAEEYVEAAKWNKHAPDVVIRSHRHRYLKIEIPKKGGNGIVFTTPAWQLKTPYAFKVQGARITTPQIGGVIVRCDLEDIYTMKRVWSIDRPTQEIIR